MGIIVTKNMARITKYYLREETTLGKSRRLDVLAGTIHFVIDFLKMCKGLILFLIKTRKKY